MLYQSAIKHFNKSIKANPLNKNAYIERAYANFELNQLNLAFEDYNSILKLPTYQGFTLINLKQEFI